MKRCEATYLPERRICDHRRVLAAEHLGAHRCACTWTWCDASTRYAAPGRRTGQLFDLIVKLGLPAWSRSAVDALFDDVMVREVVPEGPHPITRTPILDEELNATEARTRSRKRRLGETGDFFAAYRRRGE